MGLTEEELIGTPLHTYVEEREKQVEFRAILQTDPGKTVENVLRKTGG
ncbi:MAG: hypothetical protein GY866_37715 [Proteobacteria bacterium]|nr:hypothetical protein [Pseudomonadota bacterium]